MIVYSTASYWKSFSKCRGSVRYSQWCRHPFERNKAIPFVIRCLSNPRLHSESNLFGDHDKTANPLLRQTKLLIYFYLIHPLPFTIFHLNRLLTAAASCWLAACTIKWQTQVLERHCTQRTLLTSSVLRLGAIIISFEIDCQRWAIVSSRCIFVCGIPTAYESVAERPINVIW